MPHCLHMILAMIVLLVSAPSAHAQRTAKDLSANTGAIEHSARWVDAAPLRATLPARIGTLLGPNDVLSYAAPGVLFPARNIGLQCQSVNATLADVPHRAATVRTIDGAVEPRFGEVDVDGARVFRLQANAQDVLPSGTSPRCELVSYPMPGSALPQAETFWFAFSFWADDWSGTHDEQSIAQMHIQESRNILLNPFFALVVRGSEMRVELRLNEREVPNQATTRVVSTTRFPMPVRQWVTAVVQSRVSTETKHAPFFRMWLNGKQVVDYTGPFGYVLPPGGYAYPKVGIYHWIAGNPWDLQVPTRALLVGAMITVHDSTDRYNQDLLQVVVARPEARQVR